MGTHHVLIVDDDLDSRIVLRDLLRSAGFGVSSVRDGRQALTWLQRRGSQALPCAIPIVVVTAFPERMREIGRKVQALVSKPIEIGKVMRAVSNYCGRACDTLSGAGRAEHAMLGSRR